MQRRTAVSTLQVTLTAKNKDKLQEIAFSLKLTTTHTKNELIANIVHFLATHPDTAALPKYTRLSVGSRK